MPSKTPLNLKNSRKRAILSANITLSPKMTRRSNSWPIPYRNVLANRTKSKHSSLNSNLPTRMTSTNASICARKFSTLTPRMKNIKPNSNDASKKGEFPIRRLKRHRPMRVRPSASSRLESYALSILHCSSSVGSRVRSRYCVLSLPPRLPIPVFVHSGQINSPLQKCSRVL